MLLNQTNDAPVVLKIGTESGNGEGTLLRSAQGCQH